MGLSIFIFTREDRMNIVILGAGAIGRLFGIYLARSGHRVSLVDPDREVVEAINNKGLGFMEQGGSDPDAVSFVPAHAVVHAGEIREAELTLLAVKSPDTLAAVQAASHLIDAAAPIITLQTGLGNIELIRQVVDNEGIIGGFTFMAAAALGPGRVRQGGAGKTYLGEITGGMSDRVRGLAGMFTEAGLVCTPVHRLMGRLWCKVIVYSAINALSAVLHVKNGQLLESVEGVTLMKRLIDEGQQVARAQAVDLVFHDLYGLLFDACRRTEQNISSMLQDILSGQRTEIEAQCGALVQYGQHAGVATPTQQTMVELVKLLERKAAGGWAEGGAR
jgi:2-dehydropantoate 2-reductase